MSVRFGQQGHAMVEFLLVLPLLLMVVFGIMQCAMLFKAKLMLYDAAYLAARSASVHRGVELIYAQNAAVSALNDPTLPLVGISKSGGMVKVTVTQNVRFVFPLMSRIFASGKPFLPLSASCAMRAE